MTSTAYPRSVGSRIGDLGDWRFFFSFWVGERRRDGFLAASGGRYSQGIEKKK